MSTLIVIDSLTESQQRLMIDILSQFTQPDKKNTLNKKQKVILCRLIDEFLKGE